MSALQDSSHSREQSLERKPSEVSTHRLPQQFDLTNNKMKTLASHQLLAPQNLATSVSIVPASLAVTPRVTTLPPSMLQQALGPRLGPGFTSRIEATSGMATHAVNTVTAKLAFSTQPQGPTMPQQMAVNLSAHAASSAAPVGLATQPNQLPIVGQAIPHPGLYGIAPTLGARQIPMVSPRLSVPGGLGGVAIPKVAALSDLRLQATHAAPASHLPKGAVAAAVLSAPKTGHAAIARPMQAPTAASIQLQQPLIGGLVIQNPSVPHQKMIVPTGRAVTPAMPRSSVPNVSLVTSPASRVPGISLQSPMPWSGSVSMTGGASAIQVPMLQAKSQGEGVVTSPLSLTGNIYQHPLRPVGHLGAQQPTPLAIRAQPQKVLLSGPLTSLAPASSMGHAVGPGAVVATVTRVTDLPLNHSLVPAIARPTVLQSASLTMASMPQGMQGTNAGTNSTGQPHPVSLPPKSHRVVLSNPPPKPTLPVPSISISKMGSATLPSGAMNMARAPKKNIRLQSATTSAAPHPGGGGGVSMALPPVIAKAGVPVMQAMSSINLKPQSAASSVPSSIAAVPVAKVPPQAYAVQQLTSDACRLVSHGGQPLPTQQSGQQQQQHPRPTVAQGSQIIPQNALFLGSGCLQSTALPLSIPMTSTDSRQPNEHVGGPVLHQVSYALPDGARYLTQQQLVNLSNAVNYAPLQPLQTITLQGSTNLRPGLVTTQTPSLAASLQCSSSHSSVVAPGLSSAAVAMATQAGRLNTSVVVAMDASRLASLTIPQNFAAGDAVSRSGDVTISQSSVTLSQGLVAQPQHQHQLQQQQQPTVIALMQPPQQATAPGALASSAVPDSVKQQTMSPRPPILRKRNHDGAMTSAAKKSLFPSSVGSLTSDPGGSTVAPTSATPDVGHLVLASPKSFDASRENSQSSTDTASSAESTPRSCPSSAKRVKEEPQDCAYENGVPANDPGMKIVPRKKPRKQSLHANEEIPDGFSTDDDEPDNMPSINLSLNTDVVPTDDEQDHRGPFAPNEYVDDEGFRWTHSRAKNVTITGDYVFNNKPRNNHFVSSADVKVKDERRATVNELANTIGIQQNASGSKIAGLSCHFLNLAELEGEIVDRLKAIQMDFPTKASSKQLPSDDDLRVIPEILLANVQRCRSYVDQLGEVKDSLHRILRRKPQAYEIIAKHQSKRTVKKKERS